eukprot:620293_1
MEPCDVSHVLCGSIYPHKIRDTNPPNGHIQMYQHSSHASRLRGMISSKANPPDGNIQMYQHSSHTSRLRGMKSSKPNPQFMSALCTKCLKFVVWIFQLQFK